VLSATPTDPALLTNSLSFLKDQQEVYVKKWVDYSSKYGLGYLLSNGVFGVYFNDSTKIVSETNGVIKYIEKKPSDNTDIALSCTITEYPQELKKKVTLFQHFKDFLGSKIEIMPAELGNDTTANSLTTYVKKWMKTEQAIFFHLSNKVIQVEFTDKTKMFLSPQLKIVTYVNKTGERRVYPLATALESDNTEMVNKLTYTKDILASNLKKFSTKEKIDNNEIPVLED